MARVPLARPAPPTLSARRRWPTPCVAVFGAAEEQLGEALLEAWPEARRLVVALRHAPGADVREGRVDAHPDALAEAVGALVPAGPTVGIGAGFVASVEPDLVVFSGTLGALLSLPEPLRPLARGAALQLEAPRPDALRALGRRLRRAGVSGALDTSESE